MWMFFVGLVLGAVPAGIFYLQKERQRRRICRLNSEIDEILHGNTRLELTQFREGEIAILRDEIYKMTVCLREQAERLKEDKKELADSLADISHQIRTPLTSLNLMCARLSAELQGAEQKQLVRNMQQMQSRIDWLVTTLLKMSKLEAGTITFHMEEIAVSKLIKQAVEPFQIALEIREIEIWQQGKEIFFCGDPAWTQEALGNVLKNCLEYTPDGGKIRISWEENPLYVQITVQDNGPGIPEADLPHLFERFYRGQNAGTGGFGIGLSLAQMIVARENGVIRVSNCAEGGSCFMIRFHKGII